MSVLSDNMLQLLGAQYREETMNSLRYYQRATFADYIGLSSIAEFFKQEAEGERGHADKIYEYVNAKNHILPISGLQFTDADIAPTTDFVELFRTALDVELATTGKLEHILAVARDEHDDMTEQWLMDKNGLIREQVEEENLYQTILDMANQNIKSPALAVEMDNWIKKHYL